MLPVHVHSLGDTAFSLEFAEDGAAAALAAILGRAGLPGLVELVPTPRALLVIYDPLTTTRAALEPAVRALAAQAATETAPPPRHWVLPVCAEGDFAPDLAEIAAATGLSPDGVLDRLCASPLRVAMLGFLPGFAYLDGLDPALHRPRRASPRPRVPAGAVAIAGSRAAVYPAASPGGWHLLGRCPLVLFDPHASPPTPFAAGDQVRFERIDAAAFARLAADGATP
ncbi:MAG: hypothetical protein RLZZ501_2314 [Pseudomonadota bacterium]|jgi:KipI family sensor histidine kinase inhibitor